jgi:protein gp37
MSKTGIPYLTEGWNPLIGCTPASEGCANCWARALHDMRHAAWLRGKKMPAQYRRPFSSIQLLDDRLLEPLSYRTPRRCGVCFQSDWAHENVPNGTRDAILAVMLLASDRHLFFTLTKRTAELVTYLTDPDLRDRLEDAGTDIAHGQMASTAYYMQRLEEGLANWPPRHILIGYTAENQPRFERRAADVSRLVGWRAWCSAEPLLGPLDVLGTTERCGTQIPCCDRPDCEYCAGTGTAQGLNLEWMVPGGESDSDRPCDVEWISQIVTDCEAGGIRCYVKQLGAHPVGPFRAPGAFGFDHGQVQLRDRAGADPAEWPEGLRVRQLPEVHA